MVLSDVRIMNVFVFNLLRFEWVCATHALLGHCVFFSGNKVTTPQVRMWPYAYVRWAYDGRRGCESCFLSIWFFECRSARSACVAYWTRPKFTQSSVYWNVKTVRKCFVSFVPTRSRKVYGKNGDKRNLRKTLETLVIEEKLSTRWHKHFGFIVWVLSLWVVGTSDTSE